ncbi:cytochrome C [Lamprobacter modestohalophilus]|uniref:Cytochrome C n=1 Tax=Lamprobacter modestohalophilus TaxID=1064514 RepID=A0A9X0W9V7_9GAMM|nr:cytochrome c [Lamprobacter modestohalophilus]MBK1619584.1 cytochrome C [Lamprobacter modestohalophilus]MCF7976761.1 cytochrome c [Chromatiaceae bacterium]MCF7993258.1 cytochrome c [Chromatiaceae bacterium]MCF8005292.1 cytochrome c [Chromatiaceae bacterium]
MNTRLRAAALGTLAIAFVGTATAADLKPEEQIQTRQAGYSFMSWNMGKIKANLDGDYSQPQVEAAANAIAGIANSGMGALYGPGTDKDIGDVKTRVKPELFTDQEGVGEVAVAFIEAANNMAETAALGDEAEVKAAFGKLGESCKACHKKYRKD